ncbi:MAG TPA: hypothetical protein PKC43_12555 [Phycisphaerales bacterium]|nr:hypothetical protein [Phycisphaerales bacterium]HMP38263.1 hypothetical protein [Phycisphaerales bacterium]
MLHVDIPTRTDIVDLARHRDPMSVSLFLPTTPVTPNADADRILFKNLAREALDQLAPETSEEKRRFRDLAEELDDLIEDDDFWRLGANGLAVFATPENLRTFRVPTTFTPGAHASDRFHLKPLLRATTFCNACHVLALADGSVRLVEVSAGLPAVVVKVPGMPESAADAVGKASIADRTVAGSLSGSTGKNLRLRQYARKVDAALRNVLAGSDLPLLLAAVDRLDAIYRSVNTYPHLAARSLEGGRERMSEAELAAAARPLLDEIYAARLAEWRDTFAQRERAGRTTTDVAHAARAATFGVVQSMLVDIDTAAPGTIDETTGAIAFEEHASSSNFGLVDEIARRALLGGADVLAVRADAIPGGRPLAAILRYAF